MITQREFADVLGISDKTVSKFQRRVVLCRYERQKDHAVQPYAEYLY